MPANIVAILDSATLKRGEELTHSLKAWRLCRWPGYENPMWAINDYLPPSPRTDPTTTSVSPRRAVLLPHRGGQTDSPADHIRRSPTLTSALARMNPPNSWDIGHTTELGARLRGI
jgi:hypothetical protein